jgi:hypothetical protein
MSFQFAIGDFILVLGSFERIATELKDYYHAPVQFQNLSVELDLLRSTVKHVLEASTNDREYNQTLQRIRAIFNHCHIH